MNKIQVRWHSKTRAQRHLPADCLTLNCRQFKVHTPKRKQKGLWTSAYLDDRVSALQKSDGQQDALLEDAIASGVHDEVNDQIGGSFFVQVALNFSQTQIPSTSNPGADN